MDVTPEHLTPAQIMQRIQLAYPAWDVGEAANGQWYATRRRASPRPWLEAKDLADLRIAVRDWENEHNPPSLHPGPGVLPRLPWEAETSDRGEEGGHDACDAAAPRDPPGGDALPRRAAWRVLPQLTSTVPGPADPPAPGPRPNLNPGQERP